MLTSSLVFCVWAVVGARGNRPPVTSADCWRVSGKSRNNNGQEKQETPKEGKANSFRTLSIGPWEEERERESNKIKNSDKIKRKRRKKNRPLRRESETTGDRAPANTTRLFKALGLNVRLDILFIRCRTITTNTLDDRYGTRHEK